MKKDQNERIEQLLNLTAKAFFIYDFQKDAFTFLSGGISEVTGKDIKEMLTTPQPWITEESMKKIRMLFPPELPLEHIEQFSKPSSLKISISKSPNISFSCKADFAPLYSDKGKLIEIAGIIPLTQTESGSEQTHFYIQKLFNTLHMTSPNALMIFDFEGTIINANENAAELAGIPLDDLIGHTYTDIIDPAQKEQAQDIKRMLDQRIESTTTEYRFSNSKGVAIDIDLRISAMKDALGNIEAYVAVISDITEKKKTEQENRIYENNIKALLNATTDILVYYDTEGIILALNETALQWFRQYDSSLKKKKTKDLIGKKIRDILDADDIAFLQNIQNDLIAAKKVSRRIEYPFRKNMYDLNFYIVSSESSEEYSFAVYARDITDRIEAERKLFQTETRYQDIVENMNEGFVIIDRDWNINYCNQRILDVSGFSFKELSRTSFLSLFDESMRSLIETYEAPKILKGESIRLEAEINIKDNRKLTILVSITPILDTDHSISGAQAIITDITELKKAQQQLQYRAEFERLIAEISTSFINLEANEIDKGIYDALARIGIFNEEERIYVFQMQEGGTIAYNTHEWCAPGVEPKMQNRQHLNTRDFPEFLKAMRNFEVVHVPDKDELSEKMLKRLKTLSPESMQSFLFVPMSLGDSLMGFIGFDSSVKKQWSEDAISLLKMASVLFVNAIDKKNIKKELIDVILKRLSDREVEFLNYLVEGYTWPSDKRLIGKMMDVLPGTLDKFMARIKEKVRSEDLEQVILHLRMQKLELEQLDSDEFEDD
jgi:PAS domain S-box-containing protein